MSTSVLMHTTIQFKTAPGSDAMLPVQEAASRCPAEDRCGQILQSYWNEFTFTLCLGRWMDVVSMTIEQ